MAVTTTSQALCRVVGEQQLHDGLACVDHTGSMRMNDHAFRALLLARGGKVATSFDLHHADAASTGIVLIV